MARAIPDHIGTSAHAKTHLQRKCFLIKETGKDVAATEEEPVMPTSVNTSDVANYVI
jgi:hypothetical protein